MLLVMALKYGSIMEVRVKDLAEGFTRMAALKNDGIIIETYEFKPTTKVG